MLSFFNYKLPVTGKHKLFFFMLGEIVLGACKLILSFSFFKRSAEKRKCPPLEGAQGEERLLTKRIPLTTKTKPPHSAPQKTALYFDAIMPLHFQPSHHLKI